MENLTKNILVTGGGAPGAYGIILAIRNAGFKVISCDNRLPNIGSLISSSAFKVPMGNQPDYHKILLKKCLELGIDLIFPITTKEISSISQHIALFKEHNIEIIVSPPQSIEIANNKSKLYKFLQENNVPIPEFFVVNKLDEFVNAARQLGYPNKPFIFKPSVANGSRGFRIVSNEIDEGDLLFNHKPENRYISYSKTLELFSNNDFPELLLSEYLPGEEYSVDCLVNHGKPLLIIPRIRKKMQAGISVEGQIVQQPDIIAYCKLILSKLELHGPIGIQVKFDKNNNIKLLEINPRIQGTSIACSGAGINIPQLAVEMQLLRKSDNQISNQIIKWGTNFIRHYSEIYYLN